MSIAKKGSRKLVVGDETYRWKVGRRRRVSDWKAADLGLLDAGWEAHARRFGLGDTADVVFNVVVEAFEQPASRLVVRVHSRVVDGFLGVEQLTRVGPRTVAGLIARAREAGWNPAERGDMRLDVFEDPEAPHQPAVLVLPSETWPKVPEGYEPRVVPLEIWSRDR